MAEGVNLAENRRRRGRWRGYNATYVRQTRGCGYRLFDPDKGANIPRIGVQIFEPYRDLLSPRWLRSVVQQTLSVETSSTSQDVSLVIADDETVRELNDRHRGLDEHTDVLSFSFSHWGEYYGQEGRTPGRAEDFDFVMPGEAQAGLGEVVISYPQLERQARQAGHSAERECAILVAHGVLHLLGYDHQDDGQEIEMKGLEAAVVDRVLTDE